MLTKKLEKDFQQQLAATSIEISLTKEIKEKTRITKVTKNYDKEDNRYLEIN